MMNFLVNMSDVVAVASFAVCGFVVLFNKETVAVFYYIITKLRYTSKNKSKIAEGSSMPSIDEDTMPSLSECSSYSEQISSNDQDANSNATLLDNTPDHVKCNRSVGSIEDVDRPGNDSKKNFRHKRKDERTHLLENQTDDESVISMDILDVFDDFSFEEDSVEDSGNALSISEKSHHQKKCEQISLKMAVKLGLKDTDDHSESYGDENRFNKHTPNNSIRHTSSCRIMNSSVDNRPRLIRQCSLRGIHKTNSSRSLLSNDSFHGKNRQLSDHTPIVQRRISRIGTLEVHTSGNGHQNQSFDELQSKSNNSIDSIGSGDNNLSGVNHPRSNTHTKSFNQYVNSKNKLHHIHSSSCESIEVSNKMQRRDSNQTIVSCRRQGLSRRSSISILKEQMVVEGVTSQNKSFCHSDVEILCRVRQERAKRGLFGGIY